MIVGLLVGALLAAVTAAGIPQYTRSLEIVSMRAAVEDTGPYNTNIHVSSSWIPLTEQDRVSSDQSVFAASDTHLGELVTGSTRFAKSRLHWWGWLGGPIPKDELASQSAFEYIEHLDDHVEYVEGRAPTDATVVIDGEPVIEVSVYHTRARLLQVRVGDVINSEPIARGAGVVRAVVTGTFVEIDPLEIFWLKLNVPLLAPGDPDRAQPLVMFPTVQSMFTVVAETNAGLPATFAWFLYTDPVFMADMTISELETALDGLTTELDDSIPRPFVITALDTRIDAMKERALFGGVPLLLMALLIFACVGFYLALAAGLLARRRINGYMVLKSRGFNLRQQLGIHALEAAIIVIPAAVVAPLAAFAVIAALGYLPVYTAVTGGGAMPVELAASAWIWSIGAAVGTAGIITVASSFWDRSTVQAARSSNSRSAGAPWFQRYYFDAFLVGLGGIVWWELQERAGVVSADRRGEFAPDITLLAAPGLIVVASSLVALRVFPLLTAVIARAGLRSRSAAVGFGLMSVSRRPFFHGWPMLAFALAITTGIVAGSVVSTLERSTTEQVMYSTGADIHVATSGSTGKVSREQLTEARELDSVDLASAALRTSSQVGDTRRGTQFTLLGIDPIDFQRISWFRDDFSDSETSITQLVDRLAVRVNPDPIELPPGATELSLWVKSTPVIPGHQIWVVLTDGIGENWTVNLGNLQDEWTLMSARIPTLAQPVQITSVQTFLRAGVGPTSIVPVDILFDDLIATSDDGSRQMIVDFDALGLWTWLPAINDQESGFTIIDEPPGVSGVVQDDSGTGVANIALGRGSNTGIRGIYRQAAGRPIPMIASEDFMARTSVGLRRPFLISVRGGLVPVEVIESINYFPTLNPDHGPFAVADVAAIVDFVELRGRTTLTPNELFASLEGGGPGVTDPDEEILRSFETIFRFGFIDSRAERFNETFIDPVAVAGWRGISIVATIVAAAVVLMGYAIFLAAYSLRTKGESALILALGVSRRGYWVSVVAELTPAIVTGTLVGLATGFAVSSLMVGSMAHTGTGDRLLPPFLLQTDWVLPLVTIGAILTIFAVGVTNSVRSFHEIQIARMAREGFSAASI